MKRANVILFLTALSLSFGAGCKKNPKHLTNIPGNKPEVTDTGAPSRPQLPSNPNNLPPGGAFPPGTGRDRPLAGQPLPEQTELPTQRPESQGEEDRQTFATQTVYFEFDRASIKQSERSKLDEVASQLKANANWNLKIEGHCDERGTEEYNRSLGERRALAAMNYLVHAGIDSTRLVTASFGEDKPAVQGTDEAAYAKNRRSEFVVLNSGR